MRSIVLGWLCRLFALVAACACACSHPAMCLPVRAFLVECGRVAIGVAAFQRNFDVAGNQLHTGDFGLAVSLAGVARIFPCYAHLSTSLSVSASASSMSR